MLLDAAGDWIGDVEEHSGVFKCEETETSGRE